MTAPAPPLREFDLLQRIFESNAALDEHFPGRVEVPPGDDMAVCRLGSSALLLAVDSVVEDRHVRRGTPPEAIGRKAVTRNLSDVAAMAAVPWATVAAVTLPRRWSGADAAALFESVRATAEAYGCPLVGGDVAVHAGGDDPLVCSVTILATEDPAIGRVVTRAGARPGDGLWVSGALGATIDADGGGHHLHFEPRVELARTLLREAGDRVHAMIDLSDGLGRDAGHIAARSGVRIQLDPDALPRRGGVDWRRALGDGEDYELCLAVDGDLPATCAGVPMTRVGTVLDAGAETAPPVEIRVDGAVHDAADTGWEHDGGES